MRWAGSYAILYLKHMYIHKWYRSRTLASCTKKLVEKIWCNYCKDEVKSTVYTLVTVAIKKHRVQRMRCVVDLVFLPPTSL